MKMNANLQLHGQWVLHKGEGEFARPDLNA